MNTNILRKRDLERGVNPSGKIIREPVPAKRRKEVIKRAKGKCEYRGCKQTKFLKIHHKNQRSDNNRLSNLMYVCGYHHDLIHSKIKLKVKKNMVGYVESRRIFKVPKKKKKKISKKKSRKSTSNNILKNIPLGPNIRI